MSVITKKTPKLHIAGRCEEYPPLKCFYGMTSVEFINHDDVIKWKLFPRYWPFVRGIHRSPVNSPHKGQWRGALMFSLICAWIKGWVNNREAVDLRRHRAYYDAIVMSYWYNHCKTKHNKTAHTPRPRVRDILCFVHKLGVFWIWYISIYSVLTNFEIARNAENASIWWRHHVCKHSLFSVLPPMSSIDRAGVTKNSDFYKTESYNLP